MKRKTETEISSSKTDLVIDLKELFLNLEVVPKEKPMPVTKSLRTLLRQMNLELEIDDTLKNNSYLARLVSECQLFVPVIFKAENYWEYPLAYRVEDCYLTCQLDLFVSAKGEIVILDWSGLDDAPLLPLQVYLVCLKLQVSPQKVSTISLKANPLDLERHIGIKRRHYYSNDLDIARDTIDEALGKLGRDLDLLSPEIVESEISLEEMKARLDDIPELEI